MGIGPSVILDVSVDDFSSGWQQSVIWDFSWKGLTRQPSQSGRSEPTAELAQPALSSRRTYIPAAVTPDRPSTQLVWHQSVFSVKGTVFGDGTVHDALLAQFRAIHRTVDTLLQICVAIPRLSGAGIFKAPARATLSTSICRGTSTARFARTSVSPYGGWHNAYKCAVDVLPSLEQ